MTSMGYPPFTRQHPYPMRGGNFSFSRRKETRSDRVVAAIQEAQQRPV
jgi:hypothetical protein